MFGGNTGPAMQSALIGVTETRSPGNSHLAGDQSLSRNLLRSASFLLTSACLILLLPMLGVTQVTPSTPSQPATASEQQIESPAKTADTDDSATPHKDQAGHKTEKKKKPHRGAIVGIPVPTSSPAIGTGVTIMGGYIFPLREKDKVSPPSIIGGAVLVTNNGSRGLALGTELYFKEDRYHVLTGIAKGNLNYDFFGTGNNAGNEGRSFALKQTGTVFFGEGLRRIGWDIFVGPRIWWGSSTLSPQHLGESFPDLPPLEVDFQMHALGFKVERDTRPNRFYPVKGTYFLFSADYFAKDLGGTFSFQTYRSTFNAYHSFNPKQVLAYNAFVCSTYGRAPFFGQCIYGMQEELRGYQAGRYIDMKMAATQLEFRQVLPWRFGVVAFGGLGEVGPSFTSFNCANLLPGIGGGVRFNLSKEYHVNLRADIAQGKNGPTFSMGLGEAF